MFLGLNRIFICFQGKMKSSDFCVFSRKNIIFKEKLLTDFYLFSSKNKPLGFLCIFKKKYSWIFWLIFKEKLSRIFSCFQGKTVCSDFLCFQEKVLSDFVTFKKKFTADFCI